MENICPQAYGQPVNFLIFGKTQILKDISSSDRNKEEPLVAWWKNVPSAHLWSILWKIYETSDGECAAPTLALS